MFGLIIIIHQSFFFPFLVLNGEFCLFSGAVVVGKSGFCLHKILRKFFVSLSYRGHRNRKCLAVLLLALHLHCVFDGVGLVFRP